MKSIRIGVVGACGRGASFLGAVRACGGVVEAVCDVNAGALARAREETGARAAYTDYAEMLAAGCVDAVVIATPMQLHAGQAIAALEAGVHVLSEVTAAVSVEECRRLTVAARKSRAVYMMAENYTYLRSNVLVRELVRKGLFGEPHFAEAEYVHQIREYALKTPWRRKWQMGIPGNTYCTHSLGPVLQWMPGQRVTSVLSAGAGHRHSDSQGEVFEADSSNLTLCRMSGGGLVKLRLDLLSDRPHAMTNYQLQGTDGCYESARAHGEPDRIWLRTACKDEHTWRRLEELDEHLPEFWRNPPEAALHAGHGGGDYFEVADFFAACRGERPAPIGIDEAMDMTLPGLCSQLSATCELPRWVEVPDPRHWTADFEHREGQLRMVFPPGAEIPDAPLPAGYALRAATADDAEAYSALMATTDFGPWARQRVIDTLRQALPGGVLVVTHEASGRIVATALANHRPDAFLDNAGELGWVAADPSHAGRGLGRAVCAAVVRLLRARGYETIYLLTDDHRLPAIATYLKLGFEPLMYKADMPGRWQAARERLGRGRTRETTANP